MKRFDPVIKWSGSKRSQAEKILSYVPDDFETYYEPFIGGGSILYALHPEKAVCGDICEPLIGLWNQIKDCPEELAEAYKVRCGGVRWSGADRAVLHQSGGMPSFFVFWL